MALILMTICYLFRNTSKTCIETYNSGWCNFTCNASVSSSNAVWRNISDNHRFSMRPMRMTKSPRHGERHLPRNAKILLAPKWESMRAKSAIIWRISPIKCGAVSRTPARKRGLRKMLPHIPLLGHVWAYLPAWWEIAPLAWRRRHHWNK